CASQPGTTPHDVAEEVAAPAEALPPVDPSDRWGQHIREASLRFDVPEQGIRTVMRIESGGRTTVRGKPITSPKGAMGLMQVIPGTYDEMR
ncbi:transglycosylase SLT domain-containing protein, partial [Acinetobacter baumannii]